MPYSRHRYRPSVMPQTTRSPVMMLRLLPFCALAAALVPAAASADPAPFDLTGPSLRVGVTHGTTTLPIAQVPRLATGDRVTIAADLPTGKKDDAERYLLVAGFLRGATEPPPKSWFFKAETWKAKKATLALKVPEGARQLVHEGLRVHLTSILVRSGARRAR